MNNFIHDCSLAIVLHHNGSMILDFTMPYYLFLLLFMIRWLTTVHLTPSGYLPPRVSESRNVAAVFFLCGIVRGDTIQQLQQQQQQKRT